MRCIVISFVFFMLFTKS